MFAHKNHRADTLAIKAQLSELPDEGIEYWASWGALLTGKITRDEWAEATAHLLQGEAGRLHNQLILAILYNTTRASVAPPATSRHAGWTKRKREGDEAASQLALSLDPREAKKRRVKELVHSLGKRERRRIKNIAVVAQPTFRNEMLQRSFGLIDGVAAHATIASQGLSTELKRCQAAQICSETLTLPGTNVLRDRMSCGAFTAVLSGGVEAGAAVVMQTALEMHLKRIISSTLDIMRSRKRLDPAPPKDSEAKAEDTDRQRLPDANHITMLDMATLFELNPQLLVAPHVGAVETHFSAHDWSVPRPDSDDEGEGKADGKADMPPVIKVRDPAVIKAERALEKGVNSKEGAPVREGGAKIRNFPMQHVDRRSPLSASQPASQKAAPTFQSSAKATAA